VQVQIAHGRELGVPWGISECAFGDLDLHKTYQYQAFGVPALGLKRGLAEKTVIAPYATLLAVGIAPRESVRNLKRLAGLGMLDDYGFYEALDTSQPADREGGRGTIVRAYMAHHQGMSFLALANFLRDDSLRRIFRADPRVRTVEPLLQERIPILPPLHHISTRERVASVAGAGEVTPSVSQFETPHTATPKTLLLSNGRYALMLTNAGGGYSRWGDFDITRWRSDRTRDPWGTFCYLREAEGDRLWGAAYQPTGGKAADYVANFTLDRAVFRRADHEIETETEVVVAPEDDAEIRRMTLINRSPHSRRLALTSYIELAMAPHTRTASTRRSTNCSSRPRPCPNNGRWWPIAGPAAAWTRPSWSATGSRRNPPRRRTCASRPTGAASSAAAERSGVPWALRRPLAIVKDSSLIPS